MSNEQLNQIIQDAWLNIYVNESTLFNPLQRIPIEFEENPHMYVLWLMQRPEYFSFICKEILGVQLLPMQAVVLQEMWKRKFPLLIASRGWGKSWLLAVYILLRILLLPSRKVIICGSAFRQSKIIFNYMENIWYNAPILRDVAGQNAGPKHEPDMYRFIIGDSIASALPIGDGQRIRGQRANDIVADEFAASGRDIFENVIAGFGVVRSSPVESVRDKASINLAKKIGIDQEEYYSNRQDNQIILSGTAYYDFNHFALYWKRWKSIIKSKGDINKLSSIFGEDGVPEDFNWQDYSVIRIPFELVPKGFMDEAMVARSKATIHNGIYEMEYGACQIPETLIITNNGIKKIIDINVGDYVLTHRGRFRKVLKLYKRLFSNKLCNFDIYGYNKKINFTSNHPFLYNNSFQQAGEITDKFYLSNLKELNNKEYILTTDYCDNFVDMGDYIYPKSSQNKLSNYDRNCIIERVKNKENRKIISKDFNISISNISCILYNKRKPKGSIYKKIELDYYFGLCIGYYASEGSIGANGKTVEFALDGHIDKKLEYFIEELCDAIYKTFGIQPKKYKKKENTISININSRLIVQIFKKICSGICYNKYISGDILYSNKDFMKGFIVGLWNGDGHLRKGTAICQMTSLDLISQVKVCLSYFGIVSSFLEVDKKISIIKNKKYITSKAYKLNIHGKNYDKFMKTFYNINIVKNGRTKFICNDQDCSIYTIKDKWLDDYSGFVYNLEVEEDHSYSTPFATIHNCFTTDSNGFFKRSLIESCVLSKDNEITLPSGPIDFNAVLKGDSTKKYIYGIDPASEIDNFALVILEHYQDHRRIVYVWVVNKKQHREIVRNGLSQETDFYSFCARKIRDLMKTFPCERMAIDSQGGGIAVMEALHDFDKIREGELPIWPIINSEKPNPDTDGEPGLHIIEPINFSSSEWTSEANHGLRKDFEDKICLFPYFDSLSLGLAEIKDDETGTVYDTLEDCYMNIEELKNELSTIIVTQTLNGRDRWSTPEVKLPGNKKGYLRKDRYSALLMANMVSRQLVRNPERFFQTDIGGFASKTARGGSGRDYIGSSWLANGLQGVYD